MHYAILYLDTTHRVRIFKEGGYNLERRIDGIGWCLEVDDVTWPELPDAFVDLERLCGRHLCEFPAGRIVTGHEDETTHNFPVQEDV